MQSDLSNLNQRIQQLTAEMALIKAQQNNATHQTSPWLPVKEAASRLNFPSARSLRDKINGGYFPPDCYRVDPTASGKAPKFLIHVERYINKLR
jgi:hypothetical protein